MSTLHQPGQHPDADQLTAFAEHALPAHEREETLAHLAVCPHCREIIALAQPFAEEQLPEPKPIRKPWFSGWRLAIPGAIAAPVLTVLIVAALHHRKTPEDLAVLHPPVAVTPAPAPPMEEPNSRPEPVKPVRKAKAPEPPLRDRTVESLPLAGRSFTPLPQAAPSPAVGGVVGGIGTGAAQTEPPATDQVAVAASAPMSRPMSSFRAVRAVALAPLPSNLPIASTAASGARILALDTSNSLFRSEDAGQHWTAVAAAWTGRVVHVGLTGNALPRTAAAPARAPLPAAKAFPAAADQDAAASATTGVTGTISDASGAVIPGATVSAGNRTVRADAAGHYAFPELPVGSYTIEASAPGFMAARRAVSSPGVANLTLAVGASNETVTVSVANSTVELIQTPSVAPAPSVRPAVFELTTASGERWTSPDGQMWTRR